MRAIQDCKKELYQLLGVNEEQLTAWDMAPLGLKLQIITAAGLIDSVATMSWAHLSDNQRTCIRSNAKALGDQFHKVYRGLMA